MVNGKIKSEFTSYIPSTPSYRAVHLPGFLTQNQVNQLLSSCDQNTPPGCRNYAILLLLVRLGLRASEVLKLSLNDIDWQQGNIHIHGKREKLRVLPLPHEVGKAIAAYLKKERPNCSIRQIFIRSRAPYQSLRNSSNISSIVHRALLAAGLSPRHHGAHLLRYTAATESLRCGATLFEIGDLLGHCSMDTTALYTKVDIVRLQELAMPWPTVL
jgi:site-specific recombinase XerD